MSLLDRLILLGYFMLAAFGDVGIGAKSLAVLMLVLLISAALDGAKFNLFTRKTPGV